MNLQLLGTISLENQLNILRNDLLKWKNYNKKIKYEINDDEIMIDDRIKIKSIYERN